MALLLPTLLALAAPSATAQAKDEIRFHWLPVQRAFLKEEGLFRVAAARSRGGRSSMFWPALELEAVTFGATTSTWNSAGDKLRVGDFPNAIPVFRMAASESGCPSWMPPHAAYAEALAREQWALQDPSQLDGAVDAYARVADDYPAHRLAHVARLRRARLLRAHGRTDEARAGFAAAAAALEAAKADADLTGKTDEETVAIQRAAKVMATECRAEIAETDRVGNRLEEAQRGFRDLLRDLDLQTIQAEGRAGAILVDLFVQARLGQAECLLAAGSIDDALRDFEQAQRTPDAPDALKFGALAGQAECLYLQGRTQDARTIFARVSAVCTATSGNAEPRALYYLGRTARTPQEAQVYYREIIRRFPASPWTNQAREALDSQ